MAEETVQEESAGAEVEEVSLLDRIISEGKMALDQSQEEYAKDMIGEFVNQILGEEMTMSKDTEIMIKARIAQIDKLIGKQLNAIIHKEEFQKLEAAWKGLHYLVSNTETSSMLKLRVLNATKAEVSKDLERAIEFDQSSLFKKLYEEEYGTFGGDPYSLLIGDYEFGRHPQDISMLEKLSNIAAAAHAPFISAASAKLFDLGSFTELGVPRDMAKNMESAELIKWNSFRDSPDSRYVSLALPHILLRLPYGKATVPVEGLDFEEEVDGSDHGKYLWGNAAYALGQRITAAFSKYNWCAAIRGVEGGGLVEGLPVHTFATEEGDMEIKCPTEASITDRREKELNDLGFISLVHCKGTDYAAFFGGQTTNRPQVYSTDAANANARISSMLPYILATSRFAHYFKVMLRDKLGSFMSKEEVSEYLNRWMSSYILLSDEAGQELKSKYPLREGRVDVEEVPGKPGCFTAVAFLRPHFQLEELTTSIRLVAELPPPAG